MNIVKCFFFFIASSFIICGCDKSKPKPSYPDFSEFIKEINLQQKDSICSLEELYNLKVFYHASSKKYYEITLTDFFKKDSGRTFFNVVPRGTYTFNDSLICFTENSRTDGKMHVYNTRRNTLNTISFPSEIPKYWIADLIITSRGKLVYKDIFGFYAYDLKNKIKVHKRTEFIKPDTGAMRPNSMDGFHEVEDGVVIASGYPITTTVKSIVSVNYKDGEILLDDFLDSGNTDIVKILSVSQKEGNLLGILDKMGNGYVLQQWDYKNKNLICEIEGPKQGNIRYHDNEYVVFGYGIHSDTLGVSIFRKRGCDKISTFHLFVPNREKAAIPMVIFRNFLIYSFYDQWKQPIIGLWDLDSGNQKHYQSAIEIQFLEHFLDQGGENYLMINNVMYR